MTCCAWMWDTDSLLSDGSCHPWTPVLGSWDFLLRLHLSQVPRREADPCPSREPGFVKCRRLCWLWLLGGSKTSVASYVKVILIVSVWHWESLCHFLLGGSGQVLVCSGDLVWPLSLSTLPVSQWKLIIFCLTTLLSFCKRFGSNTMNYNSIFIKCQQK